MKKAKTKLIIIAVISLFLVIIALVLLFLLYDSPAQYVKKPDGSIYIGPNGQPITYHRDLFGREFRYDNGKRVYAKVPVYIEQVTDSEELSELQEAVN